MFRQIFFFALVAASTIADVDAVGRVDTFIEVFRQNVKSSPQLLQVFDISAPSAVISIDIFHAFQDAMQKIGSQHPDALAKTIADAIYLALPSMSQDTYIGVISGSFGLYLLSQEVIKNLNDSVTCATEFSNAILNNYPEDNDVNHETVTRALCYGMADVLVGHGTAVMEHVPELVINLFKTLFAFSTAEIPPVDVTIVVPPNSIPWTTKIYGDVAFRETFVKAVESSVALQSVFYSHESAEVVSKAWQTAMDLFCSSINCVYSESYKIETLLPKTYYFMSKSTYVKEIAEAFSITMIGMGTLTPDNAESESYNIASSIENLVTSLPPDADLQTRLGTVLEVFRGCVGTNYDITKQYSVFFINMIIGFFSNVPIAAKDI